MKNNNRVLTIKLCLSILSLLYSIHIAATPLKALIIGDNKELANILEKHNFIVEKLDISNFAKKLAAEPPDIPIIPLAQSNAHAISFFLYRDLKNQNYDVIFFPEHKGCGYYLTEAKRQGYGFQQTKLVSYITEPAEWLYDVSDAIVADISYYLEAELEQKSVEQSDLVIFTSNFAHNLLRNKGWDFPKKFKILPPLYNYNISQDNLSKQDNITNKIQVDKIQELVFINPIDFQHGYDLFIKTIEKAYGLAPEVMKKIKITVLHQNLSQDQKVAKLSSKLFDIIHLDPMSDLYFKDYIKDQSRLIVFSSRATLIPYNELMAVYEGVNFIGMKDGFLEELIENPNNLAQNLNTSDLAKRLVNILTHPGVNNIKKPKKTVKAALNEWDNCIIKMKLEAQKPISSLSYESPLVSVCITHFNRPTQLMEALERFSIQTYKNFEVIVMDDGSTPEVVTQLKQKIEPFMKKHGWRIFFQDNLFISKARNNLVNYAKGTLILLFEDDDLPLPDTIARFVRIKQRTKADMVVTNVLVATKDKFKVDQLKLTIGSHVLSVGGDNMIALSAISMISKDLFQKLNGYLDVYGFCYSDYEFVLRAVSNNAKLVVSVEPLYIYNFVGADHFVFEGNRSHTYQTRIALNAFKNALPKQFRNIPFMLHSLQRDRDMLYTKNNQLIQENNLLKNEISHLNSPSLLKMICMLWKDTKSWWVRKLQLYITNRNQVA